MSDNILIDVSTTLENVNVEVVKASAASIGIEYFYPQGPAGPAIWGVITGTLSSQTDLWRYLSAETFSPSQLTAFLNTNAISLCSINVNGTILSAGVPLHNIFLTAETDSQTLSYVPSSYLLSISNGNTISLSSLNDKNYVNANFLPLSGGTITGNLTATSKLSLNTINVSAVPQIYFNEYFGNGTGSIFTHDSSRTQASPAAPKWGQMHFGLNIEPNATGSNRALIDYTKGAASFTIENMWVTPTINQPLAEFYTNITDLCANKTVRGFGVIGNQLSADLGFNTSVYPLQIAPAKGSLNGWYGQDATYYPLNVNYEVTNATAELARFNNPDSNANASAAIYLGVQNESYKTILLAKRNEFYIRNFNAGRTAFYLDPTGILLGSTVANAKAQAPVHAADSMLVSGNLTATNVVYASGGNSNQWNSAFTTFTNNSTNYVIQGGNTTTTALTVGTNTTQHLILETNGISRVAILSTGNIGIGNTNPNNALTVTGSISGTNNLTIDNIFTAANATANPPVQLSQSKGIQWLNLGANPSWTAGIFGYQTGSPVLGIGIGTSAGITTEIANFRSTGIVVNQPIYFGSSSGTSNPSLRLSGANLQLRLADNSADTSLIVKDLTASGVVIVNETPIKAIAGSRNVLALGVGAGNRAFTTDFPSPLTQTTNTIMLGLNAGLSAAGLTNIFIGSNSGCLNRTGSNNIFIGNNTGRVNLSGANNIFIGENAGCKNVTGGDNVFLGTLAGSSNLSGSNNNFVGCLAGFENLSGSNNNFFGSGAGRLNTFGSNNNFFGTAAGCNNTIGNNNNIFGCIAGSNLTNGSFNNFFGVRSGQTVTTGCHNNFFGYYAGQGSGATTGGNNNIFGQRAGKSLTSGTHNNIFGFRAGYSITSGTLNNFIGYSSGRSATIASCNNFFGHNAGRCTTIGIANIAIGTLAGCNNQDGSNNIFLGTNANTASTALSSLSSVIILGTNAVATNHQQLVIGSVTIPLTGQLFGNLTTTQYLSSKTIYTDIVDLGSVEFTGDTSTSTTSFTATNTFVRVVIGGNNKYLRVYDL